MSEESLDTFTHISWVTGSDGEVMGSNRVELRPWSPLESPFSPTLREEQLQILSHIKTLRRELDKAQDKLELITSQINALERVMEKKSCQL